MLKFVITLLFIISFPSVCAKTWTDAETKNLQKFSLKSLQAAVDPSNKYLNDLNVISFGKALFNDKRLSSNGKISCNSCHIEQNFFIDSKKTATGIREGFRNTPTLLNVGQHHWFFADGAKDSLWSQALSSIENPAEQNFTRMEMMHLISAEKNYRDTYLKIFNEQLPDASQIEALPQKAGPNAKLQHLIAWKKLSKPQRHQVNKVFTNIGKSIASYVSTIKSKPTRFDHFVDQVSSYSKSKSLNASEQRGLRLFLSQESGCSNCHSGPLFSSKTFHDIGTGIPGKDNGRSEVIESLVRDEFNCLSQFSDAKPVECVELNYINRDKHQLVGTYKTSSLRSIKNTAPYMHDGRFENLNEVIMHYISMSQKKPRSTDLTPISLNDKQQADLINFLLTL